MQDLPEETAAQRNCKHPFPTDRSKIVTNYWKEGESKYKWNKAGTHKDNHFICELCGFEQHFIGI